MCEEQNNSIMERIGKWYKKRRIWEKIAVGVVVLVLTLIPTVFLYCCNFQPQIVVEPQKLDVSLSPGEDITKTISISAIGRGYTEVTLNVTEPIDKWVNLSGYLFSTDAKFVDDLNNRINNNISAKLTKIFKTKGFSIPKKATVKEKGEFLFCWDNVPGKDNETLLRVLREDFNINWAKNANISKSDNETINISKGYNSTQIKIDEKKGKATLKISDDNIHNLKVKKENDKLNIYKVDKWEITKGEKIYYIVKKEDGELNIYLGSRKDVNIFAKVSKTLYLDVNLEIPPNTTPGEYRGAIQILDNAKPKAEIPVFIKIHKTMVQIVGIEAPLKVNNSEYFKITAKIKNIGDYDALWVTANASATSTKLDLINDQTEKIPIIHKNEEVSADWWFKANQVDDWAIITVNLTGRDTEIIPVKIDQSEKPS